MFAKNLNIALIGCGRIAGHHITHTKKLKNCKVVAVCDKDLKKAKFYGKKNKIAFFSDYNVMLKKIPSINIVAIMTPSGMHYEHTIDIIKKFKKNIIIEKPAYLKPEDVNKAFEFAKKHKVKIFPVLQNRYNKAVKRLKKALIRNELGDVRIINVRVRWCRPDRYYNLSEWRGTYSQDGGALTNQGIHHVDLIRYLFGEVKHVNATMKTLGAKVEVEDSIVATFLLESGAIGSLEITTAARPIDYEASISVLGSKGMAQLGGLAVNELQIFSIDPKECKKNSEKIPNALGLGHTNFYEKIKKILVSKRRQEFSVDKNDCYKTIRLLNAFYKSDELGKKVIVKNITSSKRLNIKNNNLSKLYRT